MDKKATITADKAPFYVIFGILITGLFILFLVIVNSYSSNSAEIPPGLERYVFIQRFFNSGECFAYNNNLRAYPGILDWSKFSDENKDKIMKNCFNITLESEKKVMAFRLTLEIDANTKREVKTPNWGQNFGFQERELKKVLVYKDNKLQQANLYIEVWDV